MGNVVLVVENDELSQYVIVEMGRELGFECITADNGEQAMDLIATKASQTDVVLMDIHMPKVSRLDATFAIRN